MCTLHVTQAQEQGLQTTSASLLEEFEKDNPTIEKSQIISDGTVSPDPPTSTTSSKSHIQPPAITDQSPSVDLNASTVKPTSLQVYPNTGTSPQIGSGSSLSDKDGESSIIPNAMNILLNMDDTDISQELMVYESEGIDSEASPNSSLSFSTPSYTSPNFATNRSFSLPPRNFHSHMWRGSGRYRQYSDYVSKNYNVKVKSPRNVHTLTIKFCTLPFWLLTPPPPPPIKTYLQM